MKYLYRKRRWQILAHAVDGVGKALSLFSPRPKELPKNIRTILVVRLDHVGDLVRASAIPQLVKESFPTAKLIFLTNTSGASLIEDNPYVDEVMVFNPRWYAIGNHKTDPAGPGFWQMARLLKDKRIDLALLPRGDIRENMLAKMAGVSHRVGYGVTGGGFLLNQLVRYRFDIHEDEHTLDILRAVGVEAAALRPRLYQPVSLPHRVVNPALPWVGVHLEAGTAAKEWGMEIKLNFLEECAKSVPSHNIYFVGQNKEMASHLDKFLAAHTHLNWVNLIGKTSLKELKGLVSVSKAFVGFDSGPAHMAAALGLPTLFIFSGTNHFEHWKPLAEHATALQNKVDCSPCYLAKCKVAGHPCLSGISPALVVNWVKERVL